MKPLKPVEWIASSRGDLRSFPKDVRAVFGEALYRAQQGGEHPAAKALLHAFQKKSRKGRETSRHDIELIRTRLRRAEAHHQAAYGKRAKS